MVAAAWKRRPGGQGPRRRTQALPADPPPSRDTPIGQAPLLAVDFETTGLVPGTDEVISVGLVDVDGLRIPLGSATNFLVNPGGGVGQSAIIHHLTDDEVLAHGVTMQEALDRVFDRLAGRVLLAHHAAIEVGFLAAAVKRVHGVGISIRAVDTLGLGLRALGIDEDHPRDALRLWRLRRRAGLPSYKGHDAVVDALACAELYLALAQELGLRDLGAALRLS
ncbi:exonuclease domain-containing protein [Tessaracoccus lubricantis]|uniref:Exonuclease domain-containing protein n=1 Tax=Tessaracoccus lubricantis TaxID=545543 RepID=A0ABP9FTL7_9ACTN